MPDRYDLYNIWDQVEDAAAVGLRLRLSRAGLNKVQVVTSRDAVIKATPRIELNFTLSGVITQRTAAGQAGSPKQVPNAFEGNLSATIVTTRPIAQENSGDHGRLVGLTMCNFTAEERPFTSENLPLLQILDMLLDAGGNRVFDGKSQDLTPLGWHVWLAIANGSWAACPVPPPVSG